MPKAQMLRALVKQRLTAAAEEIFGLFERTIAEYEEELSRSKQENERQRKLLDAVFNPRLQLHRAADVQQLLVKEEVPPEQQELTASVDQEDPELPDIKEEQEGEQLQGLEEADIKFTLTSVPVKSEEDDEEKAQSSQLHQRQTEQMETEADGEDCEGPEPARNSKLDTHLQPDTDDKTSHSEPANDDSTDWEDTQEPQSGLNLLQNIEVPVSDIESNTGKASVSSSECATSFGHKGHPQERTGIKTGEKPFSCSVCGKRFTRQDHLRRHFTVHTGERPFSCSVCSKRFAQKGQLKHHLIVHTGEKPFSCSVCGKGFTSKGDVKRHFTVHTGEKRFGCSVCGRRFADESNLRRHLKIHAKQKLWFGCSTCGNDSHKSHT
ncbi:uncharacterized protein LOC117263730 isoform X1 [Epinephelus lanceolatus]